MVENCAQEMQTAICELLEKARLEQGDIVIVGCSTSEVAGAKIGTLPGPEIAQLLLAEILPAVKERELYLAVQCCEHLERALVVEKAALHLHNLTQVNAIPQPKAGGAFATAAYAAYENAVLAQNVLAAAGLDIGGTMIGMHLRKVAVPLRLSISKIGCASLAAARTRPRFVGGQRALYNENLL